MTYRNILILDGYVDEPSTLGVPPSLSPYSRYVYGAALQAFQDRNVEGSVHYRTIGQYRGKKKYRGLKKNREPKRKAGTGDGSRGHGPSTIENQFLSPSTSEKLFLHPSTTENQFLRHMDVLVLVNNTPVPGNYLGGRPASKRELQEITNIAIERGLPVLSWKTPLEGTVNLKLDGDAFLYDLLVGDEPGDRLRTMEEWDRFAVKGAELLARHPDFPNRLISEIDTLKGCVRYINGGCVFCTDPLETFRMRPVESVLREIAALVEHGGRNIRLGGSCIFSYQADGIGDTERPTPRPDVLKGLFQGIRELLPPGGVFHTDNGNAGIMAEHQEESMEVLKALVEFTSPGNSLSLGLESADPVVTQRNHLNADPGEVRTAVRMINRVGAERGENGMPRLLPGLNLLYGLPGEREETHVCNLEFLRGLRGEGNLFRRINIRQLSGVRIHGPRKDPRFRSWKEEIRSLIDVPNLMDILPRGTVLRDVHIETHDGGVSFGRQVGTYPIVVGVPFPVASGERVDVRITAYGQRSVTGIPVPFDLNGASLRALFSLPGVGRKRAARIARGRPITSLDELSSILGEREIAETVWEFVARDTF